MHTPRLTLSLLVCSLALAVGAPAALAVPPRATTEPATDITPVSATLNGTVDPRGQATAGWFQFGTTKDYGRRTPAQSVGLAPGFVVLGAGVGGLRSSTTYHFRTVAESKDGRRFGPDRTFKTAAPTTTPVFAPNPVTYGDPVVVAGQIVGSGANGAEVSLFGHAFPFTDPFTKFGNTVIADAQGNYLFVLSAALSTAQFEVRAQTNPPFTSSIQTLQVASKISLLVRNSVRKGRKLRFRGTVAPAQDGILVEIQKRQRDGTYRVHARTTLRHRDDGRSGYSVRKRTFKTGIFRAVVKSAGGALIEGASGEHSVRVVR